MAEQQSAVDIALAYTVECPTCKQPAGQRCKDMAHPGIENVHDWRIQNARKIEEAKLNDRRQLAEASQAQRDRFRRPSALRTMTKDMGPLGVSCPLCRAKEGVLCALTSGFPQVHQAREDAWNARQQNANRTAEERPTGTLAEAYRTLAAEEAAREKSVDELTEKLEKMHADELERRRFYYQRAEKVKNELVEAVLRENHRREELLARIEEETNG